MTEQAMTRWPAAIILISLAVTAIPLLAYIGWGCGVIFGFWH